VVLRVACPKCFICTGCLNPVTSACCTSVDIGANANLELVYMFCYLGNILSVDGDAYARVRSSMLHGSETWPIRIENKVVLQRPEMRMVRWMCGIKVND